jgi:hypothetical protein
MVCGFLALRGNIPQLDSTMRVKIAAAGADLLRLYDYRAGMQLKISMTSFSDDILDRAIRTFEGDLKDDIKALPRVGKKLLMPSDIKLIQNRGAEPLPSIVEDKNLAASINRAQIYLKETTDCSYQEDGDYETDISDVLADLFHVARVEGISQDDCREMILFAHSSKIDLG